MMVNGQVLYQFYQMFIRATKLFLSMLGDANVNIHILLTALLIFLMLCY